MHRLHMPTAETEREREAANEDSPDSLIVTSGSLRAIIRLRGEEQVERRGKNCLNE